MTSHRNRSIAALAFALVLLGANPAHLAAQVEAKGSLQGLPMPKADVPEIFTMVGEFVRIAYNNEGYAVLGYRMAQEELGNDWALLTVGVTLRQPKVLYTIKREHFTLQTPDGKTIPLATQEQYSQPAKLRALNERAKVMKDSINYFPAGANRPCAIKFFTEAGTPGLAWDQVELSDDRDCIGRLYFNVPGGIQPGQYWLNVQFAGSVVKVPFRIFTKEQEKDFRKQWEDLKKAHDASYK